MLGIEPRVRSCDQSPGWFIDPACNLASWHSQVLPEVDFFLFFFYVLFIHANKSYDKIIRLDFDF